MRAAAQTVRFQPLRLAVVFEPPLMFAEHTDQTMKHLRGHDIPSKGRPNDRSVLHLLSLLGMAICQAILAVPDEPARTLLPRLATTRIRCGYDRRRPAAGSGNGRRSPGCRCT